MKWRKEEEDCGWDLLGGGGGGEEEDCGVLGALSLVVFMLTSHNPTREHHQCYKGVRFAERKRRMEHFLTQLGNTISAWRERRVHQPTLKWLISRKLNLEIPSCSGALISSLSSRPRFLQIDIIHRLRGGGILFLHPIPSSTLSLPGSFLPPSLFVSIHSEPLSWGTLSATQPHLSLEEAGFAGLHTHPLATSPPRCQQAAESSAEKAGSEIINSFKLQGLAVPLPARLKKTASFSSCLHDIRWLKEGKRGRKERSKGTGGREEKGKGENKEEEVEEGRKEGERQVEGRKNGRREEGKEEEERGRREKKGRGGKGGRRREEEGRGKTGSGRKEEGKEMKERKRWEGEGRGKRSKGTGGREKGERRDNGRGRKKKRKGKIGRGWEEEWKERGREGRRMTYKVPSNSDCYLLTPHDPIAMKHLTNITLFREKNHPHSPFHGKKPTSSEAKKKKKKRRALGHSPQDIYLLSGLAGQFNSKETSFPPMMMMMSVWGSPFSSSPPNSPQKHPLHLSLFQYFLNFSHFKKDKVGTSTPRIPPASSAGCVPLTHRLGEILGVEVPTSISGVPFQTKTVSLKGSSKVSFSAQMTATPQKDCKPIEERSPTQVLQRTIADGFTICNLPPLDPPSLPPSHTPKISSEPLHAPPKSLSNPPLNKSWFKRLQESATFKTLKRAIWTRFLLKTSGATKPGWAHMTPSCHAYPGFVASGVFFSVGNRFLSPSLSFVFCVLPSQARRGVTGREGRGQPVVGPPNRQPQQWVQRAPCGSRAAGCRHPDFLPPPFYPCGSISQALEGEDGSEISLLLVPPNLRTRRSSQTSHFCPFLIFFPARSSPFPLQHPPPNLSPPPPAGHRILLPRPPSTLCSPLSNSLQTFPFAPGRATVVHRQDTAVSSSWGGEEGGRKGRVCAENRGRGGRDLWSLITINHDYNVCKAEIWPGLEDRANKGQGERLHKEEEGRGGSGQEGSILETPPLPGDQAPPHLKFMSSDLLVFVKFSKKPPTPSCLLQGDKPESPSSSLSRIEWNVTNRNRVSSSPLFTTPKTTVVSTTQEVMAVQSPWFGGGREGRRENAVAGGRIRMQDQPSERNALTPQHQVSCPETLKGENWQYEGWPKTLRTSRMAEKTKRGSDSDEGELLPDLPDERAGILKIPVICGKKKETGIQFQDRAYSVVCVCSGAHRIGEGGNHGGENRAGGALVLEDLSLKIKTLKKKKNHGEKGPIPHPHATPRSHTHTGKGGRVVGREGMWGSGWGGNWRWKTWPRAPLPAAAPGWGNVSESFH
ncbi:RNA-binding protein 25, partial [Ophiophagus hannah]